VRGGVDLHRGTEQGEAADGDAADVEHHAVEVEEHALAQLDVVAVVAEERRLHPDAASAAGEQLEQDAAAFILRRVGAGVEGLAQITGPTPAGDKHGVHRIVELA
jgi:hypothetical protein